MLTFDSGSLNANALVVGFLYPNGSNSVVAGTVNVNGGTLTVVSNIVLASRPAVGGTGSAQGALNVDGGTVLATNISGAGGASTINLKSGAIDLNGGQIAGITMLNIGNGLSAPAQLSDAASIASPNTINIASNGRLEGDTVITAPQLVINGAISPGGDDVGWVTNNGSVTLGADGLYLFDMSDAIGREGTNWDLLAVSGSLNVQATIANPFVVQLRSIDGNPNDNLPGAADFGNGSAQTWLVATISGGISNFSPGKFRVDDSEFANDLCGGYFMIQTNSGGSALLLSFVPNNPPSADDVAVYLSRSGILQIPILTLAANWTDPDGDPVTLAGVNSSSANGSNNVSSDGAFIYYTNSTFIADTIIYSVADVRTNPPAAYRAGDTVRTATGLIHLLPPPVISSVVSSGGNLTFSGSNGAPGGNYYVLAATNVLVPISQWQPIATNSFDSSGNFQSTIILTPNTPHQFYLLQLP